MATVQNPPSWAAKGASRVSKASGSDDWRNSEKLYYRIGEVSRITQIKPYVLRYWESEFSLMSPAKSRSKQRLYRKRDIETILLIKKLLYDERFTIAGAKKRLRELGRATFDASEAESVEEADDAVLEAAAIEETTEPEQQLNLALVNGSVERFRKIREELQVLRALL